MAIDDPEDRSHFRIMILMVLIVAVGLSFLLWLNISYLRSPVNAPATKTEAPGPPNSAAK